MKSLTPLTLVVLLALPTLTSAQGKEDGLPPPKTTQKEDAFWKKMGDEVIDVAGKLLDKLVEQWVSKQTLADHLKTRLELSEAATVTTRSSVWVPPTYAGASGSLADGKPRGEVRVEGERVSFGDVLTVVRVRLPNALDAVDWAGSNPDLNPSGDTKLRLVEARGNEALFVEGTLLEKDPAKVRAAVWSYRTPKAGTLLLATARGEKRIAGQVYMGKGQFYSAAKRALDKALEKRKQPPAPGIRYRWYSPTCVRVTFENIDLEALVRVGKQGAFFSLKPIGEKSREAALLKQLSKQDPVVKTQQVAKQPQTKPGDAKGAAQQLENKIK